MKIPETSPALGLRKPELEVWDLQNQLVFRRKNLEQYKFHEQSNFLESSEDVTWYFLKKNCTKVDKIWLKGRQARYVIYIISSFLY